MRLQVELTKAEFEEILLTRIVPYGTRGKLSSLYLRLDGGAEFTVETEEMKDPVQFAHEDDPTRPTLWCPDPPAFVRTIEAVPELVEAAPLPIAPMPESGWWPVEKAGSSDAVVCHCNRFMVYQGCDWVQDGKVHSIESCCEHPAPVEAASALSASSTGEQGTVWDDDIPF